MVYRRYAVWALYLVVLAGLLASPGRAAASPPYPGEGAGESVAAATESRGVPTPSSQPFSLLDSLTISPIREGRYAGSGSGTAMLFPYRTSTANPADNGVFADRQKSYLFSFKEGDHDRPYVGLARIDRLDIMQLNRTSPSEYGAEFMIGYKMPSFGSLLFGKGMEMQRPGDTSVRLQDDGWRFKFVKKFW